MAQGSGIEWTESTWNPVTGCTKVSFPRNPCSPWIGIGAQLAQEYAVSPGCKHCYAERMAERLQAMGQPNYGRHMAASGRRTEH